jgi:hypothetical protein
MLKSHMQFILSCASTLLTVKDTTKALIACGMPRAANVAQITTGRFLNIDLPSLQNV